MEVKSRPPAQQIENAKIDRRTPSTPLRHQRPSTAGGGGQLLELTPIWQKVVNGRWPSDVDRADVFNELAVRLAEPEWEVRQHGLRVLADIIPALADSNGTADLDALMAPSVLGAVTHNLAHPAPAVRASALAVLLAYLKFTADPEFVLRSIVTTGLESPAASGNLASAVVQILPKLIDQTISISHQSLVHLVTAVSKKLTHMQHQRQAIETLQRIKEHVGDSRFNHFLESYYPQIKRDLDVLHQVYRVEPNLRDSGIDLQTGQDTWSESSLSPTQPKFDDVVKIEEYDGAESDQESDDDCKIANDNDDVNRIMASNSALLAARSEADRLLLPDDDDDDDGGDSPRKSPRRVRFGGEDVKLRTPDSDVTGDNPHPPTGSAETLSFDDGKPQNGDDDDPSFEVIAGEAATTSPRQPAPQQQTRRAARSSHIPVPINPALSRPRRRSGDRSVASYETGDSSVTSSSEGETFRGRDFLAFMGQGPVPRAAGAGPGAPVPDLSFLPSELIHLLAKQDDWRTRVRGLDRLASWVSSGRLTGDQGKHLLWYMIGCLSEEPRQGRLIASVLRATRAIIAASPNNLDAILAWLVPSICRHLACGSPLPARLEAVDAIKTLMRISTPSSVISVIFSDRCVHSRSSKLRENSLLCLLYALMTFPSNEFDCVSLTSRIKEMAVSEPKRRVRQAILETLAVLSQFVPRTAMSVDTDDDDNSDDAQFFSDGLQARLARRQLPAVSHEGLILYALQIPPMTGTDVDWILAGVGSLSSGSARSRAQVDNSPKSHLSQSSDNMFHSTWSKEPSSQKMMAVGVAVPQRSYDNLYSVNNNYDERIYYSPSWSTDPRHSHPSNTQGFPHLNTSYGGRYSTRNSNNANANKNDRTADLSQTWNGSRWTAQAEIPPHVSIKSSVLSQTQNYHSGLPPIGGAHVADWRNRKDNTEQLLTSGYRVYNQDDYKKGRWDFRQDNVSFRRPAMSSYNGVKENGFIRSPVINSDASRSEPSLVGRSPHSSPARTRSSHSPSLGSAKSVENGLTASSPSLAAIRNADDADGLNQRGCSSRLGTPGPGSVNSSLISILSQPHLENESIDRGDGRSSRATRRGEDVGEAVGSESGAVTPLVSTCTDRQGAASPPPNPPPNENSAGHSHQTGTPNEPSVGTPSSDMSESSRNTEMTAKSMESLKGVNEEAKPRRRIPQRADAKNRSLRARGFEVKSSENSSLYPQSLQPFDNPRDAITKAVMQLENPEWEVIIQGLQTVVRLVRHHTKDIQGGVTHSFVVPLTKHIKNLRSQVSRGACQCARELFMTLGKHMDSEVEDLAGPLLSRMADTNKFLRGDSCGALEAMVDHASPSKSVASLVSKGAKHQNAVVRGATCRLLLRLCNRLGPEKTLALPKDTRDAILLTGAKFLTEGSLETRKYAKEMFSTLSASHRLNGILADVIPHNIMRNIQKVLTRITA